MRAIGLEFKFKNAKDSFKPQRSNTHVVENDSNCSDDEEKGVYATEFVWPSKDKPSTCPSRKLIQKNRQNEMKFTFEVSKCDRIFDELLEYGNIRLSHAIFTMLLSSLVTELLKNCSIIPLGLAIGVE